MYTSGLLSSISLISTQPAVVLPVGWINMVMGPWQPEPRRQQPVFPGRVS